MYDGHLSIGYIFEQEEIQMQSNGTFMIIYCLKYKFDKIIQETLVTVYNADMCYTPT